MRRHLSRLDVPGWGRSMLIGIDASRSDATRMTGTERYSRAVIAALMAAPGGHHFRLYTRSNTPTPPGADVVVVRRKRLWTHLGLGPEVSRRPPDALFIPSHVLPVGVGITGRLRTVITVHDVGYRRFPSAHPLRQRLYLEIGTWFSARFASAVIVDSQACAADLVRFHGIPARKITVAYPGPIDADDAAGLPPVAPGRGRPYVLFIGTLQPRKNLRRLLEAMVSPALADVEVRIAGGTGWGDEDLAAMAAHLGLGDRARFLGYVRDADKAVLLHGAGALVIPSLHEGFGFPVLEAQRAGIPVVASNTSSLPEVAGDGAILVDPLDPAAIAAGLARALAPGPERDALIERGHANASRFSWARCAEIILDRLTAGGHG